MILRLPQPLKRNRHRNKRPQHSKRRKHKHSPPLKPRHQQRQRRRVDQAPTLICKVNPRLGIRARVAHHDEQEVLVVGEQSVAGHLREETEEAGNEGSSAHAGRADHVPPGLLRVVHFDLDGGADLGHFCFDEDGVCVAFSVVFGEDSLGFLVTVAADEPSRTFGKRADGM